MSEITLKSEIEALLEREEGWNGYDALPPHPEAVDAALHWLETWLGPLDEDVDYLSGERPHVTSSAEGEVVLEWDNGPRHLTVSVGPWSQKGNYVLNYGKSWGANMETETEEGEISSEGQWCWIWKWLLEENSTIVTTI